MRAKVTSVVTDPKTNLATVGVDYLPDSGSIPLNSMSFSWPLDSYSEPVAIKAINKEGKRLDAATTNGTALQARLNATFPVDFNNI